VDGAIVFLFHDQRDAIYRKCEKFSRYLDKNNKMLFFSASTQTRVKSKIFSKMNKMRERED
jgi:hypothetical protein